MIVQWEDTRIQKYIGSQSARWYSMLGGYISRDDVVQEAALVFVKLEGYADDGRGEGATIGLFKQCTERRIIDLRRQFSRRRSMVFPVNFTETEYHGSFSEPSDPTPNEADLSVAIEEASEPVQVLVKGFCRGLRRVTPAGRLEPIDAFTRRLTGQSWKSIKPLVSQWAEASLCVGV